MGRLVKTGLALVGLAAIGGFVSLLGGPNVFSTFSSSISTLFPDSEIPSPKKEALEEAEEVKKEEQKTSIVEETVEEPLPQAPEETKAPLSPTIPEPIRAEPLVQVQPEIASVSNIPQRSSTPSSKSQESEKPTGLGEHVAPYRQSGSGEDRSGGQCATPREVRWIRLGEKCEWNEY